MICSEKADGAQSLPNLGHIADDGTGGSVARYDNPVKRSGLCFEVGKENQSAAVATAGDQQMQLTWSKGNCRWIQALDLWSSELRASRQETRQPYTAHRSHHKNLAIGVMPVELLVVTILSRRQGVKNHDLYPRSMSALARDSRQRPGLAPRPGRSLTSTVPDCASERREFAPAPLAVPLGGQVHRVALGAAQCLLRVGRRS